MKAIVTSTVSFLKTHILGIILVGIFCSVTASFIYSWIQPLPNENHVAVAHPPLPVQSAPLPKQITAEIASRPPLQRDEAAAHYVGQRFKWRVTLNAAKKIVPGRIQLILSSDGAYPWVYCVVPEAKYLWLQTAKEGTEFYITGDISEVGGGTISLTDAIVEPISSVAQPIH